VARCCSLTAYRLNRGVTPPHQLQIGLAIGIVG
jgi:hypothetical protein